MTIASESSDAPVEGIRALPESSILPLIPNAAVQPASSRNQSPFPTQVFCFHTLAHSFALPKTQPVSFQSVPHSASKNKGVEVPSLILQFHFSSNAGPAAKSVLPPRHPLRRPPNAG